MVLKQTSLFAHTLFDFGERYLRYGLDADQRHWQFEVDYSELPRRSGLSLSTRAWLRKTGLLACAIGVLHAGWAAWNGLSLLTGGILIGAGLCGVLVHALSRKSFTLLKTDKGEIWILRDQQHDEILRELRARRRARFMELQSRRVPRALLPPASGS